MKNTVNYLVLLSLFFLQACGIFQKKLPRLQIVVENRWQVAPDSVHARGIKVLGDNIFTANNDGFVYKFNKNTKNFVKISQLPLPELRDIYVLAEDYFLAMQSAEYSDLLLSKGLVEQLIKPFEHKTFLDGMDFNANGFGLVMGDPLEGILYVATSADYGKTWQQSLDKNLYSMDGEAGFAASGSTVQVLNDSTYIFVTGGKVSRFFKSVDYGKTWEHSQLNFKSGEGSGPFSIHFWNEKEGVVVGGDYTKSQDSTQNCFLTEDGGKSWFAPKSNPLGYRSSVIFCQNILFSCGSSGIDYSQNLGKTWHSFSEESAFSLATFENKVFATLLNGRVLELGLHFY